MADQFVRHEVIGHGIDDRRVFRENRRYEHQVLEPFGPAGNLENLGKYLLVALWVKVDHAVTLHDVLLDKVLAETGFTDPGGTKHEHVPFPVLIRDGNRHHPGRLFHLDTGADVGHEFRVDVVMG